MQREMSHRLRGIHPQLERRARRARPGSLQHRRRAPRRLLQVPQWRPPTPRRLQTPRLLPAYRPCRQPNRRPALEPGPPATVEMAARPCPLRRGWICPPSRGCLQPRLRRRRQRLRRPGRLARHAWQKVKLPAVAAGRERRPAGAGGTPVEILLGAVEIPLALLALRGVPPCIVT